MVAAALPFTRSRPGPALLQGLAAESDVPARQQHRPWILPWIRLILTEFERIAGDDDARRRIGKHPLIVLIDEEANVHVDLKTHSTALVQGWSPGGIWRGWRLPETAAAPLPPANGTDDAGTQGHP
jgi:hypothetical protein